MDIDEFIDNIEKFPEGTAGSSLYMISLATELLENLNNKNFIENFTFKVKELYKINEQKAITFMNNFIKVNLLCQRYLKKIDTNKEEVLSELECIGKLNTDKFVDKFVYYDYIEAFAENLDIDDLVDINFEFLIFSERYRDLNQQFFEINRKTNEIETRIENNNINLVTVLGIFTAIIFSLFGGVSIILPSLNDLLQISIIKLSIFMLIIGFIIYNLIVAIFKSLFEILRIKNPMKFINNPFINNANIMFTILIITLIIIDILNKII